MYHPNNEAPFPGLPGRVPPRTTLGTTALLPVPSSKVPFSPHTALSTLFPRRSRPTPCSDGVVFLFACQGAPVPAVENDDTDS